MTEVKFSQGAKPGKGGLLPKEKITDEIAALRDVPKGQDVISPPSHIGMHRHGKRDPIPDLRSPLRPSGLDAARLRHQTRLTLFSQAPP